MYTGIKVFAKIKKHGERVCLSAECVCRQDIQVYAQVDVSVHAFWRQRSK